MKKILLLLSLILISFAFTSSGQKIAILSDVHVTPGNANEEQLKKAVVEINGSDADAVLVTGDLSNEGNDDQLLNVKLILDGITKPLYVIPGNHENNWSQSACKTFNDLWGADKFAFTLDSLVVIGMNCGPYIKMGDGHIRQEDLIWLDETLKSMVKPGMKVLSVNHYPLLDDLDNYMDYVAVLKKYPVITHQCGHYHKWRLYETCGINGVIVRALDMGEKNYGYTVLNIDLHNSRIHVYDKKIGSHIPTVKFAYKINTNFFDIAFPLAQNTIKQGFNVSKIYADNASVFTRIGIDKDNLYWGNSLGYVKAISKTKKDVIWQYKTNAMLFSRPAVSNKYIILPTADKRLIWLNKQDGKVVYEHHSAGPYVADGVIEQGVLYQGGYKTFQAWDINAHKMLWSYDNIENYCQAAPVIKGENIYFGAWDTRLRALNKKTGKLNWAWSNGVKQNLLSPGNVVPVVVDDKVIIVAPDRVTTAIDITNGETMWREKNKNRVRESLGVSEDSQVAYAKTMDGTLVAMSAQGNKYKLLWTVELGMGYEHAPCIVLEHQGYIYTGSRRGQLVIVNAHTHEVVVNYSMGSSEVNGFEVDASTGDVYCSLVEGTIFKINR